MEIKGDSKYIEVGKPFQFRIYIDGIHPFRYITTVDFLEKIETDYSMIILIPILFWKRD